MLTFTPSLVFSKFYVSIRGIRESVTKEREKKELKKEGRKKLNKEIEGKRKRKGEKKREQSRKILSLANFIISYSRDSVIEIGIVRDKRQRVGATRRRID